MKRSESKLKLYLNITKEMILRSPVEVALSLMFFVVALYRIVARLLIFDSSYPHHDDIVAKIPYYIEFNEVLQYFFLCIAVSYSLNIIFNKRGRIFYYLSLLFPVIITYIIVVLCPEFSIIGFIFSELFCITQLCSLLLIFTSRGLVNNREFASNAIKVSLNLLSSIVLSFITYFVLISIKYSLFHIIGISSDYVISDIIGCFCMFIITPLLFLTLEYKGRNEELKHGRVLNILINYILTPSVLIYGVILYMYFSKVAILRTLPEGVISTTAIIFLTGGVFVSVCRSVLTKVTLDWVFKYFTYISIPAVVLAWIGAIYRISEYGLTGNRIYLLITLTTLTLWMIAILSKRYGRFHYLTVFIVVVYMTFSYMPYVGYQHFERVSKESKKEREKDKSISIRLGNENSNSLDISEYRTLVSMEGYDLKGNNLEICRSSDVGVDDTINIDILDVLDSVYANVGIEDYKTLPDSVVRDIKRIPLIYKKDGMMITFHHIEYKRDSNIVVLHVRPDCWFEKREPIISNIE